MMLSPYIAAIQIGNLQIQSEYTRPTTTIVEVAPEDYHPILNKEDIQRIESSQKPIEPLRAKKLAKLKPKHIPKPKAPRRAVKSAPAGWYPYGQCTYWVWTKRAVPGWNDASDWKWQATRDGWTVSSTPVMGAIAWEPGHVAYVESVSGSTVTVSEMNVKGLGIVSTRTVPATTFKYIY